MNTEPDSDRIQVHTIAKFISKQSFKSQKELLIFKFEPKPSLLFLGADLKNTISFKEEMCWLDCFSLHFLPLDPDSWTQMNPNPTGSTSLNLPKES